ncbi:prepilin-type N-terminal cleavage/methylation domain-containing protein [Marinimicrobium alkaliphilum]|uniref:prepilin-type N-terminal cleavage/methylation domain-containing protein n=1 Tax=Marinimicrobium alkaliphilum TaxID=2202654 RepID=UPI000DB969A3|nr:type II secretion system protein [Marinimicrobium alkaliphilum]
MKKQAGFTLIELIAVIVILGIIAAVAVPRFVDLSNAAEQASVRATAASITSGSSLNYANEVARNAGLDVTQPVIGISNCNEALNLVQGGGLPDGYSLEDEAITAGSFAECDIVSGGDTVAMATVYGATAAP